MLKRLAYMLMALILIGSSAGCFGGSKATGKFSNQDKPKPAEGQK